MAGIQDWRIDSEEFLSVLASEATRRANDVPNPYWKRAHSALSDAADRLHAMTMRIKVTEQNEETR